MADRERNIFGRWSDLVAGSPGQEYLRELVLSLITNQQPQAPSMTQQTLTPPTIPSPAQTPMPLSLQRPQYGSGDFDINPQTQTIMRVPTGTARFLPPAVSPMTLPTTSPQAPLPSTIAPLTNQQPSRSILGNILRGVGFRGASEFTPGQLQERQNRNQLLLQAIFGAGVPLAMASTGDTGLAMGSGLVKGFSESLQKQKEMALKKQIAGIGKGVWTQSGLSQLKRNVILGTLRAGYYLHPITNQRLPVRTKQDAIDFVLQQGYIDYAKDPQIKNIVDKLPFKVEIQKEKKKGWFLGDKSAKSAGERFNELTKTMSENEAYAQLIKEGF